MAFRKFIRYSIWLIGGLVMVSGMLGLPHCAKVVAPVGGPRDTIPPEVRKAVPENFSRRFDYRYFEVSFNEFIQLKDVNQKLIVSPPLNKKPEVKLRGKSIRVSFEEELLENTTYTFNFNDAIVDNNEGNPLEGFEYVFSTGDELDSLFISGQVINAFSLEPEEGVYAMLYKNLNDSAPYLQVPYYVGKTGKEGNFRINNLGAGTYRLFALKDMNMNYMFDQATEAIAFHDSLIVLPWEVPSVADTVKTDSLLPASESIPQAFFLMRLFTEEAAVRQYIASTGRPSNNQLQLIFSKPQDSIPRVRPEEYEFSEDLFITESNPGKDTLIYWIRDSVLMEKENLVVTVEYLTEDSVWTLAPVTDTLTLRYTTQTRGRRAEQEATSVQQSLILSSQPGDRGIQGLNLPLFIRAENPVEKVDTSRIIFVWIPDSVEQPVRYELIEDSLRIRQFNLLSEWEPGAKYRLEILPEAFTGYLGNTNDTLSLSFTARKDDYYGTLFMNVTGADRTVIVQLLGKEDRVLQEYTLNEDARLEFPYLAPDKYRLRAFWDANQNGQWDTGKYLESKQPEEMLRFSEEVNIRSNWEMELNWKLSFETGLQD